MMSLPIPPSAMRYWIESFTMLIASSSRATVCGAKPAKRKSCEHLAHDRPAGPQAPPARVAASLVGALRAARGALPWTAGTIFEPTPSLDEEAVSSTNKLVSRVRLQGSPSSGIRDHHRLERLITIPGMRT